MQNINSKLAEIFKQMSLMYRYTGNKDRFRAISYERASNVIKNMEDDISEIKDQYQLENLKGIGKSIAEKIIEFLNTGKIKRHEELKNELPIDLMELIDVRGFGPATLKQIYNELQISTKQELLFALQSGKLNSLKGFGSKKIKTMKDALNVYNNFDKRMLLWDAINFSEEVIKYIKNCKWVKLVEIAGSLRRQKETIGDIDLILSCNSNDNLQISNYLIDEKFASIVLAKGKERVSVITLNQNKQIDIMIVNEKDFGSALQHFTGSKEHNIALRTAMQKRGLKLSEHGIFNINTNQLNHYKTEIDFYKSIGYDWIPPEMRENKGELELAEKKQLPTLVNYSDIKGDMQMHSSWSDGLFSIDIIVEYVRNNFNYEYIVITDHSKTSKIAHGITEKQLEKQIKEIKKINQKLGLEFVKTGIEVDILKNGNLDFSNELLSQLDWVTASIHSGFKTDNTDRIIRACENKYVDCIGHPTGRLIGKRNAYSLDFKEIITVAKKTGTAFEINSQPERMDLNEDYAVMAKEQNVMLVINTDAHQLSELNYMKTGISVARRAWCEKKHILNTFSWDKLTQWRKNRIEKS